MKNLTFYNGLLLVVFLGMSACVDIENGFFGDAVEGNGKVIEASRSVGEFSKISVSEGINAFIVMGEEENIKIEADENLEELIVVEVKGDWLKVHLKNQVKSYKKLDVYITADDLEAIKSSSSADVMVESDIEAESFSAKASSAGSLSMQALNVNELDGSASSSGKIYINDLTTKKADLDASSAGNIKVNGGTIEIFEGKASSSGDLSMSVVQAQKCFAKASSGGDIWITVNETLEGKASSGGSIKYSGSPQVDKMETSSGGSISKE